jgi:hypothetical protein
MIKSKIGIHAGLIWQQLDRNGERELPALKEELKLDVEEFYLALGWLARENKIAFYKKDEELLVFLVF